MSTFKAFKTFQIPYVCQFHKYHFEKNSPPGVMISCMLATLHCTLLDVLLERTRLLIWVFKRPEDQTVVHLSRLKQRENNNSDSSMMHCQLISSLGQKVATHLACPSKITHCTVILTCAWFRSTTWIINPIQPYFVIFFIQLCVSRMPFSYPIMIPWLINNDPVYLWIFQRVFFSISKLPRVPSNRLQKT